MPTMPTNNLTRCLLAASLYLAAAFLPAAAQTAPSPSSAQASAATVEALLKAENNLLLAVAAPAASRPSSGGKSPAPRLQVEVLSIYGPADQLKADLVSGGQALKGVRAGTRVGSCTVSQVADRCVAFAPVEKAKPGQCPTACWTGKSALAASAAGATGAPLPQPFPAPSAASFR